jgi:transcriptional regulator with XRE-family HTH domain
MGKIIRFPRRKRHARASSDSASRRAAKRAKASNVISKSFLQASATIPGQCGLGMPLDRQPLTVESDWESACATARVPPQESMMESQVKSMPAYSSRIANLSRFATCETTFPTDCGAIGGMNSPEDVRRRLIALRVALGYGGRKQSAFAEEIGLAKNVYNPFESDGRNFRPLTLEAACRIRKRFGVPLDWIFFGDMSLAASPVLAQLGPNPTIPNEDESEIVAFKGAKALK